MPNGLRDARTSRSVPIDSNASVDAHAKCFIPSSGANVSSHVCIAASRMDRNDSSEPTPTTGLKSESWTARIDSSENVEGVSEATLHPAGPGIPARAFPLPHTKLYISRVLYPSRGAYSVEPLKLRCISSMAYVRKLRSNCPPWLLACVSVPLAKAAERIPGDVYSPAILKSSMHANRQRPVCLLSITLAPSDSFSRCSDARNARVSCSADTSNAAMYGPMLAPTELVATWERVGNTSSTLERACLHPSGSSSISNCMVASVVGGGGGGETSYAHLTFGSRKVVFIISYAKDSSLVAPSGQKPSKRANTHEIMIWSRLIAEANALPEHKSFLGSKSGPDVAEMRACSTTSASVGSRYA